MGWLVGYGSPDEKGNRRGRVTLSDGATWARGNSVSAEMTAEQLMDFAWALVDEAHMVDVMASGPSISRKRDLKAALARAQEALDAIPATLKGLQAEHLSNLRVLGWKRKVRNETRPAPEAGKVP